MFDAEWINADQVRKFNDWDFGEAEKDRLKG